MDDDQLPRIIIQFLCGDTWLYNGAYLCQDLPGKNTRLTDLQILVLGFYDLSALLLYLNNLEWRPNHWMLWDLSLVRFATFVVCWLLYMRRNPADYLSCTWLRRCVRNWGH